MNKIIVQRITFWTSVGAVIGVGAVFLLVQGYII